LVGASEIRKRIRVVSGFRNSLRNSETSWLC